MIRDKLISLLDKKFGVNSFSRGREPNLIATFPPAHPAVGELRIFDDDDEIIVEIGEISHSHFGRLDVEATQAEAEQEVAERVVDFVEAVFDGKYILWRSKQRGAGGWKHVDFISENDPLAKFENDAIYFTWSGPLRPDNESRVP